MPTDIHDETSDPFNADNATCDAKNDAENDPQPENHIQKFVLVSIG